MSVDSKRLRYSIKGKYLAKPLVRWFYAPLARPVLHLVAVLRLPVSFVNFLSLILLLAAGWVILRYNEIVWVGGVLIYASIIFQIVADAWFKYSGKSGLYQKWVEETSWLVGIFIVFSAGAVAGFIASQDYLILVLWGVAVFSFMMMHYSGALIEVIRHQYEIKEDLSNVIKQSLGKRNSWIVTSPLGFSFEYQWSVIVLLVLLNQFVILFWLFIIFGNLKWLQGYVMLKSNK